MGQLIPFSESQVVKGEVGGSKTTEGGVEGEITQW